MQLARQILRLGRVKALQIGFGDGARAALVDDLVHHGDRRFGQDAGRGIDDVEFFRAEFIPRQPELVFPVQQHVAELFLGERNGRAARAGVEHRHVVVEQIRNLRLDLGVLIGREVLRRGGGRDGFGLALGRGEIMRLGVG